MDLQAMVDEINAEMPEGITVSLDGEWQAMYSFKMKAYVLLDKDGRLTTKGAALKSRGLERLGTAFLKQGFDLLLRRDIGALRSLYLRARRRIIDHDMDVGEFAKTEVLNRSLDEYLESVAPGAKKKKARRAVYELLKDHTGEPDYREGDRVSYYNCGTRASHSDIGHSKLAIHYDPDAPDENTPRLLKRLEKFAERFRAAFSDEDFGKVFSPEDVSDEGILNMRPVARRVDRGDAGGQEEGARNA